MSLSDIHSEYGGNSPVVASQQVENHLLIYYTLCRQIDSGKQTYNINIRYM